MRSLLYWQELVPTHEGSVVGIFVDPPHAGLPPPLKGHESGESKPVTRPSPEAPREPDRIEVAAVEVPPDMPPEPGIDQAGFENGSEKGTPEGQPGGKEGGVPGGKPDGLGDCWWCDGNGPVLRPDQIPRLLVHVRPIYPPEAAVKRVEGTVLVEALVDSSGQVANARVLRSIPLLDAAALAAVRQWRFAPALHHGVPVSTIIHAPIEFHIY